MADEFTWGIWMSITTPYGKKASGTMKEDTFRKLLRSLVEVTNDTDRSLDRIKEIMVHELNRVGSPHGV